MVGLVKQLIDEFSIEHIKKSKRKAESWKTDRENILIKKDKYSYIRSNNINFIFPCGILKRNVKSLNR